MSSPNTKPSRLPEILIAVAIIISTCIVAVALLPTFIQWLVGLN